MLVEGSRWTKIRDKVTHEAEKVGEEALEHVAAVGAADLVVAALGRKR
jgi:phosphoribosyl-ATP pyrophosphohydrolase